jgi:acyl carrier protein
LAARAESNTASRDRLLRTAVDRLAAEAVAAAAPVRVAIAASPAEREAVYRLRYHHVIQADWATPEELPDEREHDGFDARAVHIVAWSGDQAAGTCRLVFPDPTERLPVEVVFELVVEPLRRAPTLDRLLVEAGHRGGAVTSALLARAWQELRRRGFESASAIATEPVMRLLGGIGLELTVLGGPRLYWGEERYAVLCAPSVGLIARDELGAPPGPGEPEPEIPLALIEILADYRVDPGKLTATARLVEDLGLDSLELVGVVVDLEERLGIQLGDELAGAKTLGEAIARVTAKAGSARWTLPG